MEKFLTLMTLALSYLRRHFRRYLFLFVVLAFGFAVITLLTSLKAGMDRSVYRSAQSHYAGDLVVTGENKGTPAKYRLTAPDQVVQAAADSGIPVKQVVKRTIFGGRGLLFFNGVEVRQKYVLGVDWDEEADYFSGLSYHAGGPEELTGAGDILISRPVARELGARMGDRVTLQVKTRTGQVNTGSFVIRGIVDDATIFGYYKCYINRQELNALLRFEPGDVSVVGFYLQERSRVSQSARALQGVLRERLPTGPLVSDRDELEKARRDKWSGIRHFIITVPVYLSEVADLLDAMTILSYFLYTLMVLIILVSVGVTFRLILHEREQELGTMRALGFQREELTTLLLLELLFLFLLSLAAGFLLALAGLQAVGFFPFERIPSFEIFMTDGRLEAVFRLRTVMGNVLLLLTVLVPAVLRPALAAVRRPLAPILTGGSN